jgi:nicotinate-nucleotide adenylyltransferase
LKTEPHTTRCGLYFGSFNPLHVGHLAIANYMLEFTDLQGLRLVITPQNPLKNNTDLLPLGDRLHRIERAIASTSLPVSVSTVELDLPKPNYTINTLRYFAEKEPHIRFVLIIGADNLAVIEEWHQWRELLHEFEVYVYPRRGYPLPESPTIPLASMASNTQQLCTKYGVRFIDAPLIDISSSFIRKGWAEGRNMNGFIPNGA